VRRLHADLLLLLTAAIWGLAFVFQKSAMHHIGPYTFIAARGLLAALALAPFAWYEARNHVGTPTTDGFARIGLLAGAAFFVGAVLQQIGLITATVSNTGFLTGLYVVITPFVVWAWQRRQPSALIWGAVALSFVGTWLLGGGSLAGFSGGDGLVAVCAVFWAVHLVIVSQSTSFNRPIAFTAVQFAVVGILGLAASLVLETTTAEGLRAALPAIAYVGLLSSALTFTLLAIAMKHAPASEAAIIISLEAVFAAIAGGLLLGETLGWIAVFGAGLIMAAIMTVQLATASVENVVSAAEHH
jgi:drug/metabolite transporter (DMT)-like permease